MSQETIVTKLELQAGYKFVARFEQEGLPPLLMDEPFPVGEGTAPNASQVLSAAVGNCLSASALFCLQRAHIPVQAMQTRVVTRLGRNPKGRVRIAGMTVDIRLDVAEEYKSRMSRCMELFEDFCIVTESVRQGIPVDVSVDTESLAA